MPIGRERARKARDKLRSRLKGVRWVHSVSLSRGPYGYCVALTVDTSHPEVHRVPMHIDGVEVITRASKRERAAAQAADLPIPQPQVAGMVDEYIASKTAPYYIGAGILALILLARRGGSR